MCDRLSGMWLIHLNNTKKTICTRSVRRTNWRPWPRTRATRHCRVRLRCRSTWSIGPTIRRCGTTPFTVRSTSRKTCQWVARLCPWRPGLWHVNHMNSSIQLIVRIARDTLNFIRWFYFHQVLPPLFVIIFILVLQFNVGKYIIISWLSKRGADLFYVEVHTFVIRSTTKKEKTVKEYLHEQQQHNGVWLTLNHHHNMIVPTACFSCSPCDQVDVTFG